MQNIFKNKLYFFYLSVFGFLTSLYLFNEFSMDDYNLHIEMGKWMVLHSEVPHIAVGSWYGEEVNLPWIAHEWLSQVIFYGIFTFLGSNRDIIRLFCCLLCMFFIFIIVFINKREMEKHYITSFLYLMILSLSFYGFFVFRPQIFSFVLFFVEVFLLMRFRETLNTKYLFVIPVLAVFWSNLHGGSSVLVYVLPIMLFVFNIIPIRFFSITHKFVLNKIPFNKSVFLLFVSVLSIFALMINPYGYQIVLYPYTNMMDTNMLTYILEWVPLNITMREHQLLIFPVILFVYGVFLQTKTKIDFIDFMFLLVFVLMTFKSGRFIMYFSIYSSFCMWKYFNCAPSPVWGNVSERVKHNLRLTVLFSICILTGVLYKISIGNFLLYDDQIEKHQQFFYHVSQENPKRLWNRLSGNEFTVVGVKPFVDGRADAFTGEPFMIANRNMNLAYHDPEELINKYHFDFIALYVVDPMMSYLKHNPEKFTLVYKEDSSSFPKDVRDEAIALYRINN